MVLHQVKPVSIREDKDPEDDGIGAFLFEPDPEWIYNPDPLWDIDQERFESQHKAPPEIEELRLAAASRDLAAVQKVFTSQWFEKPEAERIDIDDFWGSLVEAIHQDDVPIASHLLSNGVSMNISHFTMAAELKKYAILQLFLDLGWDINQAVDRCQPPPLS